MCARAPPLPAEDDLPDARISGVAGTAARNFATQRSLALKPELAEEGKRVIATDGVTMALSGHLAMALLDYFASVDCNVVARAMDKTDNAGSKSCVEGALSGVTGALKTRHTDVQLRGIAEGVETVVSGGALSEARAPVRGATRTRSSVSPTGLSPPCTPRCPTRPWRRHR